MVFSGPSYYPLGGMDDFINDFEEEIDAIVCGDNLLRADSYENDWYHVWDTKENKKVIGKEND